MTVESFLSLLGEEVVDVYEESILLFSTVPSSRNLGFLDSSASSISVTAAGQDLTIYQSPTLLSSTRQGGTTGAVLWKVTPIFAEWICDKHNILFTHGVLTASSSVLELGGGSAAVLALTLGTRVGKYYHSDQEYVMKLAQKNLDENLPETIKSPSKRRGKVTKTTGHIPNISAISLDWETDDVRYHPALQAGTSFSAVIACDTIYNEALIKPFVDTCIDACSLSRSNTESNISPAVTIVAQELRSPEVFENWLETFQKAFHTYRIHDDHLIPSLRSTSGYSVHVGILRSGLERS
ncbi:uncharacterized protein H6S33_001691 [Morchella sextelata]|uniref:uncharacterized protein n=1 Tax=Morchella sextelata TaxID=1174677 RepID=UPI001D055AF0|nr:uncharacterized protein H6S33_001691 [Morchella sextelata]KAH0608557.1 hypothetical protein H6S33_001691 [Morchella sextelata]